MKLSATDFVQMKGSRTIAMLTAYTCPVARELEAAGIPIILVGDTVGMVEMGFDSTREVTVEHMVYHIGAVRRGAPYTHIIGDLPFESDKTPELALANAKRLLAAGADREVRDGRGKLSTQLLREVCRATEGAHRLEFIGAAKGLAEKRSG